MNLTPPSSNILKDDSNINSNPVSELTFDSFWDTLGFKELHFILSVLINACDQVKEGDLKSKLKDALYFIAGVRTNSYGNSDRYRHTRVLFHDTTMDDTTINILCENMESNKYDDLLPTATNQSDYLNTVNSNIPMNMTHLLQLFVFNSNEADSLFLHGRMEYFFQFQRIKCAIPILLANIDYTNAYMMNLCREEFPNFINAFSDFVDPSHTRILYDDISVSSDTTRPNNNLQPIKGAAKYLNFHARLNPDEFLKKKYRWIKRFLDWIDLFSVDIYDNYDFDQDKYKPKRRAASVKWTKKDFGISCEFFKVQDQFLFALSDEQPLDSHLRFYLENHQSALDNVITWQENNSFVFKVTLRLCLSSYLPFLNDSTCNALYFRLVVIQEDKVQVTFIGVDGYAADFFFPSTLRELKRSFLFVGSFDDCTAAMREITGEYSCLSIYAFGRSLSLSFGRFVAGIIVFLWTQFALSEAVFEVISILGILMRALLSDIDSARDRVQSNVSTSSPQPIVSDTSDSSVNDTVTKLID